MDYYEELGLTRAASAEEIKSTYKTLVRLLHPDAQHDDATRNLAELQLRRLNGIAEVLLSPARRRRYDLTLELAPLSRPSVIVTQAPALSLRLPWRRSLILVAAGIVVGCLGQLGYDKLTPDYAPVSAAPRPEHSDSPTVSDTGPPAPLQEQTPNHRNPDSDPLVETTPRERTRTTQPRAQLSHVTVHLSAQPTPAQSAAVAPQTTAPPAVPPPVPPLSAAVVSPAYDSAPSPAPAPEKGVRRSPFHGTWTYAAQFNAPSPKLYAPEYIELSSTVDGEFISGSFRSRYYVTDQPLSPNVNFEFFGRVSEPALTADWVGSDGARGTISMRLLPSGAMRVDWVRNKAGSGRTLAYGHAVLLNRDSDSQR